MRTPFQLALWLPAFALAATGCGSGPATVSGSVTYQGKPLHSGKVTLVSANGQSLFGTINPNGAYSISGAPPGPVKIAVDSPPPPPLPRNADPNDGEIKMMQQQISNYVPIPPKYKDPDASGLTSTLHSGTNDLPLDLK